ncbi:hypothetical protein TrST_g1597 [Triparma strigata]|uniref:OPA3-like protein n=1 Tax=Triparma strigata TaxID=1606541 RepID=A0A9W6ZXK6_9STRA|nr:hypothetical protein TrST_g1597 [Triparma strigata]
MAAALPLTKLLALLIKTLSKPLSKSLKTSAASHPSLSQSLNLLGQASHQITARLNIWSSGFKVKNIGRLNDDKALQKGSDIFGETIVLSVASGVVIFEYQSSAAKAKAKEDAKMREMEAVDVELQTKIRVLQKRVDVLERRQLRILGTVKVDEDEVRQEIIQEKNKLITKPLEKKTEKIGEEEGGWLRKKWLYGYNLKWLGRRGGGEVENEGEGAVVNDGQKG